jgi:hypothetical protein
MYMPTKSVDWQVATAAGTAIVPVVSVGALLDRVKEVLAEAGVRDGRRTKDHALAVRGHLWELQAATRHLASLVRKYDKRNTMVAREKDDHERSQG